MCLSFFYIRRRGLIFRRRGPEVGILFVDPGEEFFLENAVRSLLAQVCLKSCCEMFFFVFLFELFFTAAEHCRNVDNPSLPP